MDVVINIEPDQEEEMCNKQKPQKKRSCSIWFWLCLIIVPVAIGAGLTAFFLIPRGPDPTPQPPTTSPETPSSTTPRPIEKTTIPTTTAILQTTTTDVSTPTPHVPGDWLRDIPLAIGNAVRSYVGLHHGQVTHENMLFVCNSMEDEMGVHLPIHFNSRDEEFDFDKIIHANNDTVFGNIPPFNLKRLLWTGCYYEHKNKVWNTKCGQDPEIYNNFCNQPGWKNDLEQLKASTGDEIIYIVKDYNNSCWQLYDSNLLKSIMGYNSEEPILPFTCLYSVVEN